MKILFLLLIYFSYYVVKGIIVKKQPFMFILGFSVLSLWYVMYTIVLGFSGTTELILKALLFFGLAMYLLRVAGVRLPVVPVFSLFELNQDRFHLRYLIFKPGFLLLTNIYCMIKRVPAVHLSDVIEVDVKVADQQIFMLRL